MKAKLFKLLCLLLLVIASFNQRASAQEYVEVIKDEYVVQFDPSVAQARKPVSAYSVLNNGEVASHVRIERSSSSLAASSAPSTKVVKFNSAIADSDCSEIQKANPAITSCEPNYIQYNQVFPNDSFLGSQFWHYSPSADGVQLFDIRSPFAWDFSQGSDNVIIAVLDSGINYFHPDLVDNLWRNPNETPNDGIDNDGNGYIDDIVGIDAFQGNGNPLDCNGHGSHVAGIIGARGNNGRGVAGVMWRTKILSLKQGIDCGPSVSTAAVIKGIEYLINLKRRTNLNVVAVNASYGGKNFTLAESNAIKALAAVNIVFVAAAGNDGVNIDNDPRFPAAYDHDNIITVANLDTSLPIFNLLNESSNYGANRVHLGAPGTEILSTVHPIGSAEQYDYKTGTSMAAPVVTGAFGLYASHRPQLYSYKRRIEVMLSTAFPVPALSGVTRTGKMVNLFNLMSTAELPDNCPSDTAKADPGVCGCNQPENYADGDGDQTADCADSCPADGGKTSPGTCGCGVADTNSDGDAALDCQDQCPSDPGKTTFGACGCGVPDADGNGNGQIDCFDAQLAAVKPTAPKLSIKKGKLAIKMQVHQGPKISYLVRIDSTKKVGKKKKTTTKFQNSAKAELSIKPPASGVKLSISYQLVYPGQTFASQSSVVKGYSGR